jgi:hypothetical protein
LVGPLQALLLFLSGIKRIENRFIRRNKERMLRVNPVEKLSGKIRKFV